MELKHGLYLFCMALGYPFSLQTHAQQGDAPICTPSYKVEYNACKQTGKILSVAKTVGDSRVATHQCEPNEASLCESAKDNLVPGISPSDIRILKTYHKDVVDVPCGSLTNVRAKVDVFCVFEYPKPNYETVADPSCPVSSIVDQSKCFSDDKSSIHVNPDFINGCLSMRPVTESEVWIKSTCLMDVYKAANDFKLKDLNSEQYKQTQEQLMVLQKLPSTPPILATMIQAQDVK